MKILAVFAFLAFGLVGSNAYASCANLGTNPTAAEKQELRASLVELRLEADEAAANARSDGNRRLARELSSVVSSIGGLQALLYDPGVTCTTIANRKFAIYQSIMAAENFADDERDLNNLRRATVTFSTAGGVATIRMDHNG